MDTAPPNVQPAPPTPERLKMTYAEYLAWADEDTRAEWVNGEVIIYMPPTLPHQLVATFLLKVMGLFVDFYRLGIMLPTPFEMKLRPDGPSREPDLVFIAAEHLDRLSEKRLNGPADLAVELISDDSVSRDRDDKFKEYEAAGVTEYWVLDPRAGRQRADFWVLGDDGTYHAAPLDEGTYRSTVLPGFWLRVDWLWQTPLPEPLAVFAAIVGTPALLDYLRRLGGSTDTTVGS